MLGGWSEVDHGPFLEDGAVWCFTWGDPSENVLDSFALLLAGGDLAWVIVPIPMSGAA